MANQYKNKVVFNGTTLMDISDTTAVQSDVASGKSFYTASGQKVLGTGSTDTNTTYSLSMSNNVITLIGSDGVNSTVTLPVYGGEIT